jgi:uncharacterized membrane protein
MVHDSNIPQNQKRFVSSSHYLFIIRIEDPTVRSKELPHDHYSTIIVRYTPTHHIRNDRSKMKLSFGPIRTLEGASLAFLVLVASDRRTGTTTAFTSVPLTVRGVPRNVVTSQPLGIHMKSAPLWAKTGNSYRSNLPVMTEETEIHGNKAMAETPAPTLKRKSTDPTPVLFSLAQKMTKEPTMAVSAVALALVLMLSPTSASAAMSGGRMGGSFPSQRSSSSRPMRPSSSYSGGSSSYGGGYSRGSSFSRGFQSGYGTGLGTGLVSPFYSPFGFPRPMYFGGPGAIVYNRGPSVLDFAFFGGIAFVIANTIRNAADGNTLTSWDEETSFWGDGAATSALGSGTSTVQISVAMDVPNRNDPNSILSVLDRLSRTAQTDSRVGIQNLSSQVALELLRRKSSIVSASSRYKHFGDRNKAQRDFNELSIQERGKFEQETVSKYGGVDYSDGSGRQSAPSGSKATMAVITIMLAIDGDSTKIGTISSIKDVEDALRKIAANAKIDDCLQGAEILWTPEDQRETLSLREVVADYPELRSV